MIECLIRTIRSDGLRGLYYGLSSPLSSVPLINAIVFGAYAHAKTFLTDTESLTNGLIAGAYAGFINCIVACPTELVKCRMQVQSHDASIGQSIKYSSSWDCAYKLYRSHGIKELYTGMTATIYREVPAYAGQFFGYEMSKKMMIDAYGSENSLIVFLSGMIGGINCWIWSYPQDIVKTLIQVSDKKYSSLDGGFYKVSQEIMAKESFRGFWKGFTPCLQRAMLANGCGFLAFEYSMKCLKSLDNKYGGT